MRKRKNNKVKIDKNARNSIQLCNNTKAHVAHSYTISLALYGMLSCRKTWHTLWQKIDKKKA